MFSMYGILLLGGGLFLLSNAFCIPSINNRKSTSLKMVSGLTGTALIIQNKGGGHGEIGYELAKTLVAQSPDLEVIMLQDKCNYEKAPFSSYQDLKDLGVKIYDTEFEQLIENENKKNNSDSDSNNNSNNNNNNNEKDQDQDFLSMLHGKQIDYIIDNYSKGKQEVFIELAKKSNTKQYLFVSSAGMYKSSKLLPLSESSPVHITPVREYESCLEATTVPYTCLRPQYIYGAQANKHYLDYFIGRAFRKLQIPLPLHGDQLLSLTNIKDVASLIALAINHPNATNQIFNCVTDRYISYKDLAILCHNAYHNQETDKNFLYYDPEEFDTWKSKSPIMRFPFRSESFIVSCDKATQLLGWSPSYNIVNDINEVVNGYKERGGCREKWTLDQLRYDMEIVASKDHNFMFTYPFFDDDQINLESMPYSFEKSSFYAEPENNL